MLGAACIHLRGQWRRSRTTINHGWVDGRQQRERGDSLCQEDEQLNKIMLYFTYFTLFVCLTTVNLNYFHTIMMESCVWERMRHGIARSTRKLAERTERALVGQETIWAPSH